MIRRPKTVGITFPKPKEKMKIKQSLPSFLVRDRFTFKLPSLNIGDIPQEDPTEILKKYKEEQLKFYANERKARETQIKQEQEAREREAERQANEREQERIKRLEENALKLEEENKRLQEEADAKLSKKEQQRKKAIEQATETAKKALGIREELIGKKRELKEVKQDIAEQEGAERLARRKEEIKAIAEEEERRIYEENASKAGIDIATLESERSPTSLIGRSYSVIELKAFLKSMGEKVSGNKKQLTDRLRDALKQ